MNALFLHDGYKSLHHTMLPRGLRVISGNLTPRGVGYMPRQAKDIVVFGNQYAFKYIVEYFNEHFFDKNKRVVLREVKQLLSSYTGKEYDVSHFAALHDLGYLPIRVKALKEGTIIPAGSPKIPVFVVENTHPDFGWLTLFLETLMSSLVWKPMHSASIAYAFKKIVAAGALETNKAAKETIGFLAHDFSFRGMQHPESAMSSGMGWLTSFNGTDTIPALWGAKHYYYSENVGFGIPATEHSVMCVGSVEPKLENGEVVELGELELFRRLLALYPSGYLGLVSDTWDLWKVCTEYVVALKEQILARDGKLVIRPDSGNPVDIICGTQIWKNKEGWDTQHTFYDLKPEEKGVIELLWDVFGGTISDEGYKVLDIHIGVIYGDAITLDRAEEIHARLKAKGFATTNIVFGVGSYSMGYATRDQQGVAVKATYCEIEVEGQIIPRNIFKDPITDDGLKKSAKGLLKVYRDDAGKLCLKDECTPEEAKEGLLQVILEDGILYNSTTIHDIRKRIDKQLQDELISREAV